MKTIFAIILALFQTERDSQELQKVLRAQEMQEYAKFIWSFDFAAIKHRSEAATLLYEDGRNYLHYLASQRDDPKSTTQYKNLVKVIRLLRSLGTNVNQPALGGYTPLHQAADSIANYRVTRALLECGADPNLYVERPYHDTPLSRALRQQMNSFARGQPNSEPASARALVEWGADLSLPVGRMGGSVLAMAAWNGMPELVELMLKKGARVNQRNNDQETPLHAACMWNTPENARVVRILLRHGADRNAISKKSETPLQLAKRKKFDLIVKAFQ